MNYLEARSMQDALNEACTVAGKPLDSFPCGATGLTPDDVKASPEYKAAKASCENAFQRLRAFNTFVNKTFAKDRKEYMRERAIKRECSK